LKKIVLSAILLFLVFVPSVFAHSGLSSSVPKDGEIIQEEVEQVTLTFNTSIESTSTLKVTDKMGNKVSLAEISVNNKEMMGTLESPLTTGTYQVDWKIIGQDGHPIEGEYSFTIESFEKEEPNESIESQTEEITVEDIPEDKILREGQPNSSTSSMMIAVAYILIAALAGAVVWLFRRGGK